MALHHFYLDRKHTFLDSIYRCELTFGEDNFLRKYIPCYSVCDSMHPLLSFAMGHGRYDHKQDMDDWGFSCPAHFQCAVVVHNPEAVLLQGCTEASVAFAQALGLEIHGDTISIKYLDIEHYDDLLVVPNIDGQTAYFGNFAAFRQQ